MELIDWKYFEKIEIRVGTIIKAEEFPEARKPAYKLSVDFGEQGIKKSSAQITDLYKPDDLIGKQVIAVINFQAKQVGSFFSECLVTGFYNVNKQVILAVPDQKVENGSRLL